MEIKADGIGSDPNSVKPTGQSLHILDERAGTIPARLQIASQVRGHPSARFGTLKKKIPMYHTEIHVKGKINPNWSDWFGDLQMQETLCDETILRGELTDMAAVYGVISRLGSLVIPLVSVTCSKESD